MAPCWAVSTLITRSSSQGGGGDCGRGFPCGTRFNLPLLFFLAPRVHLPLLPPADYGFDPLRLGSKDKDVLKYYREGELTNGRWAMAAVAGILFTDLVRGCG